MSNEVAQAPIFYALSLTLSHKWERGLIEIATGYVAIISLRALRLCGDVLSGVLCVLRASTVNLFSRRASLPADRV